MIKKTVKRNKILFTIVLGLFITCLSAISYTNNNILGGDIETKKNYENSTTYNNKNFPFTISKTRPKDISSTSPSNATNLQALDVKTVWM